MSEDLLRQVAGELNRTPGAAERVSRTAALVIENNGRVAAEATANLAFDSSPYAYQAWLASTDKR
jgi:hypothetical protein